MDNRSSDEVNNRIVELEKELQKLLEAKHIISEQYSDIKKEILLLKNQISNWELQRADFLKILNKSKFNIEKLELELSIEKKNYWTIKNENR